MSELLGSSDFQERLRQIKNGVMQHLSPSPPVIIEEEKVEEEVEPLPFLKLQDRNGAFADLWFDYGSKGKVAADDPRKTSWRQPAAEKAWEKDLLETDFISKIVGETHYYCPLDKVAKSLTFLLEVGWHIEDFQGRRVVQQGKQELSLQMRGETILITGKNNYEEHQVDISKLVGAFNRRERFIDLSANTVGLIDPERMEKEWGELADEEKEMGGIRVKKNNFGLLDPFFADQTIQRDAFVEKLKQRRAVKEALPSSAFQGKLHPYQQEGVNWLDFLYESGFHGVLADEMGLGKTVQVLAFLSRLETSLPILIVMPTSLLFNWRREFEKFLPDISILVHSGQEREKSREALGQHRVIFTSYALLRQDRELFKEMTFSCVILDEAQTIKNPDSLIAKCTKELQSQFRLAITGTPVENRSDDLWSLFSFLMPELLGSRQDFIAQLQLGQSDGRYTRRVQKKITPFILRRRKSEVAQDLPPKIEQVIWVEMDSVQRGFYEEWMAKNRKKLKAEGGFTKMEVFEAILRLRQICCAPQLIDPSLDIPSAKQERLISDLEEVVAFGGKVLVYSQFTQMLQLLQKEIVQRGWKSVYLDGSTQDREEAVRQFQEDPEVSIFLVSLKAGGVGLNLTAADYVFLYDPWWNTAVENQAIDRAHRFGRKWSVIARRYVAALSIEEKIMRLKEHKLALAQGLLDFEAFSLDDLCSLLTN
jgi:SNF2 family DNA or RNA helicase